MDAYKTGETPRVLRKKLHTEPRVDALSGEEFYEAGWIVVRPLGEVVWHFESLNGILTALSEGTFGLKIREKPLDVSNDGFGKGWIAGFDAALASFGDVREDEPTEPCCPEETCETCPDAWTCAGLRASQVGSNVAENGEPLGWDAPENCR